MSMLLFVHLALHFGSCIENLPPEALGYVLQRSGSGRSAVGDLLRGVGLTIDDNPSKRGSDDSFCMEDHVRGRSLSRTVAALVSCAIRRRGLGATGWIPAGWADQRALRVGAGAELVAQDQPGRLRRRCAPGKPLGKTREGTRASRFGRTLGSVRSSWSGTSARGKGTPHPCEVESARLSRGQRNGRPVAARLAPQFRRTPADDRNG